MSLYLLTCLIQGLARPTDRSREAERGAGRSRAGRRIGAGGVYPRPPGLRRGSIPLRQWVAGPDRRRGVGDGRGWEARCGAARGRG